MAKRPTDAANAAGVTVMRSKSGSRIDGQSEETGYRDKE